MDYWKRRDLIERVRLHDITEQDLMKILRREYLRVSKEIMTQIELLYREISAGKQITADMLYRNERYWQLISELDAKLNHLGNIEVDQLTSTFSDFYSKSYNMATFTTLPIDDARVTKAIMSVYAGDGKNFSDRIWANKRAMIEKLREGLVSSVASGQNWAELSKSIKNTFGVSFNQAQRLVRTELTHIQTQATIDKYADEGIDEVEFLSEHDACPDCLAKNRLRYKIGKEPIIPMHPNCRCTYLPVIK